MGRIHLLPPNLVNKIAAGECVERPASVLKELVENSLDAEATRIEIAIEGGGKQLIRVADDGAGMDGEDLALAIQPHATSKLADESDLFALHTMGFRGEALPSIGSVAQVRIVTRPAGADSAFALEVNGGVVTPITPAPGSRGTVIEVRNLFFNTPARRKFLKADSTEIAHLGEALARIALSYTEVHFRMTHNGRLLYDLPATGQLGQRVADFFGGELADCLIPVERPPANDQSPGIRGLIAPPQHSRLTPKWQYIFLNGRYIRDRFIQHAVREAYRGLMEPSRQPVVFLYLLLPAELVDFNVHPTKIEVRFADSNRIHSAVLGCLRDRLTRTDLTAVGQGPSSHEPGSDRPRESSQETPLAVSQGEGSEQFEEDEQTRQERIREALAEFFKSQEPTQRRMVFEPDQTPKEMRNSEFGIRNEAEEEEGKEEGTLEFPTRDARDTSSNSEFRTPNSEFPSEVPIPNSPSTQVVQIHNTYLVCQTADGLIIVDQHALHERIIYETLLARLTGPPKAGPSASADSSGSTGSTGAADRLASSPSRRLQSQRLLIPQRVALGARQAALLLDPGNEDLLARLGLELTPFSRDEVAICAFPALLSRVDPAGFLRDLADKLADEPPSGPEEFMHEVLDMMACKAAIKAGDPLTPAEINALLAQRDLVDRSSNCPHGRPTTLKFSLAELEKQFKRR